MAHLALKKKDKPRKQDSMPQRRVFVTDAFGVLQDACIAAVQAVQTVQPLIPLTILVPHDSLADHLCQAIARAGRGHVGVRFFRLIDFARACAEDRLDRQGWRPLPRLAAPLIVKNLLAQLGPEHLFGGLADQPSFPTSVLETLADCKHAGVTADGLHTFVTRAGLSGVYRKKIESLAMLYGQYQRFLTDRRLYDDQDMLEQAALELEASQRREEDGPRRLSGALFVYGFSDFSPLQRRLIVAALQDRDGLVFFPWRAGNAYAHATPTLSWLRSLGFTSTPLARSAESGLSRLHRSLFEEVPQTTPDRVDDRPHEDISSASAVPVRCLAAPSYSREAREISRMVLSLVRDHRLRFSEIGIVLRDPARYGPLLTETFKNLGIPSWLSGGLPLLHTSAGRALHLLCRMLVEDYAPDRVFEFLRASQPPYASLLPDAMVQHAQPDRWHALVQQAGIVSGRREWQRGLAQLEKAYEAEKGADQATAVLPMLQACMAFMRGLFAAAEPRPSRPSWHAWADYSWRLYRTYSGTTVYTDHIEELLLDLAQLDLSDQTQHPHRSQSARQDAPTPRLEDWAKAVSQALATQTDRLSPTGQTNGVFIGELSAARGVRFRAVIIPGMVDGGFPRSVRQDPLLLDAERQHLAETLGCELAQRSQHTEEERLLFCLATQSAVEHLILSYPSHDQASGRPQLPSWYLLRVLEALRGQVQTFADLEAWCQRVPLTPVYAGPVQQAQDALEFHLATVEQALASGDVSVLGYLPLASPAFSYAQQAIGQRLDSPHLTAFDGLLKAPEAKRRLHQHLFPSGVCVSPSALETYARCPFLYFLSHVLGLTPADDAEEMVALSPRQRGLLLHAIVYDFFSQLKAAGQLPMHGQDPQLLVRRLIPIADQHFTRFAELQPTGLPLLWELEQEQLREGLIRLVHQEAADESEFVPHAFEVAFGSAKPQRPHRSPIRDSQFFPDRPVSFSLEDGEPICLQGRIDRIDVSSTEVKARIIDYKTGHLPRGRSQAIVTRPTRTSRLFAAGTALQLPLYLFAARSLRPDLAWESASYVGLGQRVHTVTPMFSEETWPESVRVLRSLLTTLLEGIRSGCFFPHPDTCYPCPFPEICGSQVGKRMRHKRHDPRWAVLHQLHTIG